MFVAVGSISRRQNVLSIPAPCAELPVSYNDSATLRHKPPLRSACGPSSKEGVQSRQLLALDDLDIRYDIDLRASQKCGIRFAALVLTELKAWVICWFEG